jgi:hypothetical protein
LSVFAGGFTLEAPEDVSTAGAIEAAGVLVLLGNLMEQSLIAAKAWGFATSSEVLASWAKKAEIIGSMHGERNDAEMPATTAAKVVLAILPPGRALGKNQQAAK